MEEIDSELCEVERNDISIYIPNIDRNIDYDDNMENLMEEMLYNNATLKCNYTDGWSEIVYFLGENDYNEYMALRREIYDIENELEEIDKAMDKDKENRKKELTDRFMELCGLS